MDHIDKIEQLARLHRDGALSDDEFASQKADLLTPAKRSSASTLVLLAFVAVAAGAGLLLFLLKPDAADGRGESTIIAAAPAPDATPVADEEAAAPRIEDLDPEPYVHDPAQRDGLFSQYIAPSFAGRVGPLHALLFDEWDMSGEDIKSRIKPSTPGNFGGGRYYIYEQPCGSSCRFLHLGDFATGEIYGFPMGGEEEGSWEARYYPDSTLVQTTSSGGNSETCDIRFFNWTGSEWVLVKEETVSNPQPPAYCMFE